MGDDCYVEGPVLMPEKEIEEGKLRCEAILAFFLPATEFRRKHTYRKARNEPSTAASHVFIG